MSPSSQDSHAEIDGQGTDLEDVVDNEVTADDDQEQGHVNPAKETELSSKLRSIQAGDERDES